MSLKDSIHFHIGDKVISATGRTGIVIGKSYPDGMVTTSNKSNYRPFRNIDLAWSHLELDLVSRKQVHLTY